MVRETDGPEGELLHRIVDLAMISKASCLEKPGNFLSMGAKSLDFTGSDQSEEKLCSPSCKFTKLVHFRSIYLPY